VAGGHTTGPRDAALRYSDVAMLARPGRAGQGGDLPPQIGLSERAPELERIPNGEVFGLLPAGRSRSGSITPAIGNLLLP
jgi:hypothetical protein